MVILASMFAASILFLSAFLLFSVQPLLGKALLPLIGGAVSGWLSLLVFFQLILLAGYALAFVLSRRPALQQARIVWVLLAAGCIFLPPHFGEARSLGSAAGVIGLLLITIGLPALALSMLSSTVQRVVAGSGRNPYVLYAASNAGSLLGLLSYPLLLEPLLSLSEQRVLWAVGYGVLLIALGVLLLREKPSTSVETHEPTTWAQRRLWVLLAAIPASISYGLVSYVTFELGSFPLFWVIPLALYLISFIIAFSSRAPSARACAYAAIASIAITLAFMVSYYLGPIIVPDRVMLACWMVVFLCMVTALHTRLAAAKPAPAALSEYYLWLALGGAIGGLFNVFVAPFVFVYPVEFFVALAIGICVIELPFVLLKQLRRFVVFGLIIMSGLGILLLTSKKQVMERNFFGTAEVFDAKDNFGYLTRYLTVGMGYQGQQQLEPVINRTPQLYFTQLSGLFAAKPFNEIGMIGIGAGMALCYSKPGREFTVYELDPKMRRFAERDFTYVQDCGAPTWRMGDGRIELQKDADKRYDLIIVDAFHGVNMPVHLITREALALYRNRLKPNGFILYNINSWYYNLYPQVAAQAREIGWQALRSGDSWVLLADASQDLSWLTGASWQKLDVEQVPVWRDDWANPLGALLGGIR